MTQAKSLESLGVDLFRGILSFRDDGGICSRETNEVININSRGTYLEVLLATTETISILAKFGKCRNYIARRVGFIYLCP
jgi:hypothetical protein